jgi:hypothetical protein
MKKLIEIEVPDGKYCYRCIDNEDLYRCKMIYKIARGTTYACRAFGRKGLTYLEAEEMFSDEVIYKCKECLDEKNKRDY